MNSSTITIPMPDPLFQIFLGGLFFLHAVFMNLVLGGTLVMVATEILRLRNPHTDITRFARVLAARLPVAFLLAVVLGLVSLMGLQVLYGPVFKESVGVIGNLWFWAGAGLIVGYGGLHLNRYRRDWYEEHPKKLLLMVTVSALGFMGVALVFVSGSVLMLRPEIWPAMEGAGWTDILVIPSVLPRFFHLMCAAVAGTGTLIAMYGVYLRSQWNPPWANSNTGEEEYGLWVTRFGVIWVLTGTLPQIVVGPWLLMVLPDTVRSHLIAGDTFGSLAFFFGLTSALFSLVLLNAALMVPSARGFVVAGVMSVMVTMGFMVIVRETVRFAWLTPYMDSTRAPSDLPWVDILTIGVGAIIGAGWIWHRLCAAGKFAREPLASEASPNQVQTSRS